MSTPATGQTLSVGTSPMYPENGGAVVKLKPMTAADHRAHITLIQEVLSAIMKSGVHYDIIPGTDKPTLLKPGAEVVLTTFRLGADPEIQDLSTEDEIRYRLRCRIFHQPTNVTLGWGVGEASTNEEKYKWRKVVCEAEFEETPADRRRIAHKKGRNGIYTVKQIRTTPADVANTVLKMAKKRALVDGTLTCTAASDMFTQDVEDLPEGVNAEDEPRRTVNQPRRGTGGGTGKPISDSQLKVVKKSAERKAITEAEICNEFRLGALSEISTTQINDVMKWIESH